MSENSQPPSTLPEEVALRLWHLLNASYGMNTNIQGSLARYIECREAVLRGEFDPNKLG